MSLYNGYGLLHPNLYQWPITYRWIVQTPTGTVAQTLTMDVPELEPDINKTILWAGLFWGTAVATATSDQCACTEVELYDLLGGGFIRHTFDVPIPGARPEDPCSSSSCPTIQIHSGRMDRFALRTFHFVGSPRSWSSGGLLTDVGMRTIENTAQAYKIAMERPLGLGPIQWLNAYRNIGQPGTSGHLVVGVREVEYVRVCHHTGKAPIGLPGTGG